MANARYNPFKELCLSLGCGQGDLPTGTLSAVLVDKGVYTYSAAHEFLSSVGAGIVGTPASIASPTFTNGVLDGADVTFLTPTGPSIEAIVICLYTGVLSASRLIAFMDTGVTGLPFTPDGSHNYSLAWGANIFST